MDLIILCIFDSKANAFLTPFFAQTTETGIRDFRTACNDSNSNFYKHPDDFTIFEIGSFSQQTAEINVLAQPISHGLAITYKEIE